jgi:hypothetical protein
MPMTLSGRDVTGDLVDVERRGVRREDRAGLADLVELAEDRLLQLHVLEHRFDDEVAVGEVRLLGGAGDQRHPLLDGLGGDGPPRGRPLVVPAHDAQTPIECLLVALDDGHRDADVGEVHRDAPAHRAGAEDAAAPYVDHRRVLVDAGDLVGGTFGEEGVPLRRGLRAGDELHEQATLDLDALVERQVRRGLDALDDVLGGEEATRLAVDRGPERREQVGVALRLGDLVVAITHPQERQALGHGPGGEGDGCGPQLGQVTVDHLVDEARLERLAAADVAAGRHHLQRLRHAREAGESLRAAATGEQPEVHLGQAELRRPQRHPVVRGECGLEAAAERGPVDRRDHRDRCVLHRRLHLVQADGLLGAAAELGDVGAGDERPAVADDDDTRRPVLDRLREPVEQTLADVPAEGVHRRVVDDDHGDVAGVGRLGLQADGFGQRSHPASLASRMGSDPNRDASRLGSDPIRDQAGRRWSGWAAATETVQAAPLGSADSPGSTGTSTSTWRPSARRTSNRHADPR